jgi:phosphoserine phosphatase
VLKLVALDMDGTLVDVASSWRVVHDHFGDHNDEGLRLFLQDRIDDHEFIRMDIRVWWKHAPELTVGDLEAILAKVPLMPGARELVKGLHARGARTAIVSGGLDLLARRVGQELGIDVVLANGVRVTPEGRLTGEGIVRVPIHDKEGVLAALQAQLGVSPAETAGVGNSEIDIGLFRRSRVGVAFLPEDEAVRRAATTTITERNLARVLDALDAFPSP